MCSDVLCSDVNSTVDVSRCSVRCRGIDVCLGLMCSGVDVFSVEVLICVVCVEVLLMLICLFLRF